MNIFKEIEISEPIWKSRSIGLNIEDVPLGEKIKVSILYKTKDGKLLYPGDYIINVNDIRNNNYKIQKIRGNINVHIVPIEDLKGLISNNKLKKTNMLFGSKELGKIIKESKDAKAGNFENKKTIKPGKYIMKMKSVVLDYAKSDKNPMIIAEFELDEDHRTIKDFMKIEGPNTDIPRQKLVRLFYRGFGYEIQACKTESDLMNQLQKFEGKTLSVAVKGITKAYCFEKDGNDIVMEQIQPEFWYCGTTSEFDDMSFDQSKSVKPLNDEDKEKLVRFAEINGGPYIPSKKQNNSKPEEKPEEKGSIEKEINQLQEEIKEQSTKKEEKPEKEEDEDFPF